MLSDLAVKSALLLYNMGWKLAIPILQKNCRLAEGFKQRTLQYKIPPAADIWIQSASAGESYLAAALLKNLKPFRNIRIFLTTNTAQGMEILNHEIDNITQNYGNISAYTAYFPFDSPSIMDVIIKNIHPKVMILLESEIWPGLIAALKKYGCKILVINGRITSRSLARYLICPSIWHKLKPDKILAVSEDDAKRFAILFGKECVDIMSNMKFDRIGTAGRTSGKKNSLHKIFQGSSPIIVLGSVRRDEEPDVKKIIIDIYQRLPEVVIAVFPRHIHRIKYWEKILRNLPVNWILRSKIKNSIPCKTVILWDTFGELSSAYGLSQAAFVGGSLAPLGGQNFLEPLVCGVAPVIGPYWDNFAWVGDKIVKQGLVRVGSDWTQVANLLAEDVKRPYSHEKIRIATEKYVENRQNGTDTACKLINEFLNT